jgi:hypothetical protein
MGELADILLDSTERAEQIAPPAPVEKKTSNRKTIKPVFRKVALRSITPEQGAGSKLEVHRAYGERGDFEKVTVTLPADVRGMLLDESLRRKKDRSTDWPIAAIVREAIAAYLSPSPK